MENLPTFILLAMVSCTMCALTSQSESIPLFRCQRRCINIYYKCSNGEELAEIDCKQLRHSCSELCNQLYQEYYSNDAKTSEKKSTIDEFKLSTDEKKSTSAEKEITTKDSNDGVVVKRACLNDCEGVRDLCFTVSTDIAGVFDCNMSNRICRESCN